MEVTPDRAVPKLHSAEIFQYFKSIFTAFFWVELACIYITLLYKAWNFNAVICSSFYMLGRRDLAMFLTTCVPNLLW